MNNNFIKWILPAFALIIFFNACKKKDRPSIPNVIPAKGIFVLNEGGFGSNNASLGYYDFSSNIYTGGLFQQQNGFKLGDVANDALIYGGKLYIVVNNSGLLMITNAATGKMIDSVSFKNANKQSTSPRHIVAYNGKVYVSTWLDGVKVIDTASLKITQSIALRNYGEGIAVANGKLCVGLSGPWGAMDSVVSVFALPAGSLEKNMVVGKNLGHIVNDNTGNIIVNDAGQYDYASDKYINGGLSKVNIATGLVTNKAGGSFGKILLFNNTIYALNGYNQAVKVKVFDAGNLATIADNFITDGTTLKIPYGIAIDETNGDMYVTDAVDYVTSGRVYAFGKDGKKKFDFTVTGGIDPNAVLFKR